MNGTLLSNSGSSYAAPQVSGVVALLAQAFSNHTPEQLVDRILASANNSFFTVEGYTNFNNGIKHGYGATYGHGIVDALGALSPINTGLYSVSQLHVGSSVPNCTFDGYKVIKNQNGGGGNLVNSNFGQSLSYDLNSSQFIQSGSFGKSIAEALQGKTAFYYDSMNGGFRFNISSMFGSKENSMSLKSLIISDINRLNNFSQIKDKSYDYTFSNMMGSIGDKNTGLLSFNIDTPSAPIQFFNSLDNSS